MFSGPFLLLLYSFSLCLCFLCLFCTSFLFWQSFFWSVLALSRFWLDFDSDLLLRMGFEADLMGFVWSVGGVVSFL